MFFKEHLQSLHKAGGSSLTLLFFPRLWLSQVSTRLNFHRFGPLAQSFWIQFYLLQTFPIYIIPYAMLNTLVLSLKTIISIRVLQFLIWQSKKIPFHERNSCNELLACHSIKYTYLNEQEYSVFTGSAYIISKLKQLSGFNSMAASLSVHVHLACSLRKIFSQGSILVFALIIQLFGHFAEKKIDKDVYFYITEELIMLF